MATRANSIFKLLQNWASERVKQAVPGCRAAAFDFSRVQDWAPDMMHAPVSAFMDGRLCCVVSQGLLHNPVQCMSGPWCNKFI